MNLQEGTAVNDELVVDTNNLDVFDALNDLVVTDANGHPEEPHVPVNPDELEINTDEEFNFDAGMDDFGDEKEDPETEGAEEVEGSQLEVVEELDISNVLNSADPDQVLTYNGRELPVSHIQSLIEKESVIESTSATSQAFVENYHKVQDAIIGEAEGQIADIEYIMNEADKVLSSPYTSESDKVLAYRAKTENADRMRFVESRKADKLKLAQQQRNHSQQFQMQQAINSLRHSGMSSEQVDSLGGYVESQGINFNALKQSGLPVEKVLKAFKAQQELEDGKANARNSNTKAVRKTPKSVKTSQPKVTPRSQLEKMFDAGDMNSDVFAALVD